MNDEVILGTIQKMDENQFEIMGLRLLEKMSMEVTRHRVKKGLVEAEGVTTLADGTSKRYYVHISQGGEDITSRELQRLVSRRMREEAETVFITTGEYSLDAKDYGGEMEVTMANGEAFSRLLGRYGLAADILRPQDQLDVPDEGEVERFLPSVAELQDHMERGREYFEQSKFKKALKHFEGALDLKPKYSDAWRMKARCLFEMGHDEQALDIYKKAITMDVKNPEMWFEFAEILYELGRHDEEIECYNQALSLNKNFARAWNNKGATLFELSSVDDAIECFLKAVGISPGFEEAWHNMGLAYKKKGDYKEALRAYYKSLALDKEYMDARMSLIHLLDEMQRYEEASDQCHIALGQEKKDERLWYLAARAFKGLGMYQKAIRCADHALEITPSSDTLRRLKVDLQFLLEKNGDQTPAIPLWDRGWEEEGSEEVEEEAKVADDSVMSREEATLEVIESLGESPNEIHVVEAESFTDKIAEDIVEQLIDEPEPEPEPKPAPEPEPEPEPETDPEPAPEPEDVVEPELDVVEEPAESLDLGDELEVTDGEVVGEGVIEETPMAVEEAIEEEPEEEFVEETPIEESQEEFVTAPVPAGYDFIPPGVDIVEEVKADAEVLEERKDDHGHLNVFLKEIDTILQSSEGPGEEFVEKEEDPTMDFPDDFESLAKTARLLYLLGRSAYTLEACERALAIDEKDDDLWVLKGNALYHLGRIEGALEAYQTALKINPRSTTALLNREEAFHKGRYVEEKSHASRKITELWPNLWQGWAIRGCNLMDEGEYEAAIESLEQSNSTQSGLLLVHNLESLALLMNDDQEESLDRFTELVSSSPNNPTLWNNRGVALFVRGGDDDAIDAFERTTKLYPGHGLAWNNRGVALHRQGKVEDARDSIDTSILKDRDEAYPVVNRGIIQLEEGDADGAIENFEQAIWLDDENPFSWYCRGLTLLKINDEKGARDAFFKAVNMAPEVTRYQIAFSKLETRLPSTIEAKKEIPKEEPKDDFIEEEPEIEIEDEVEPEVEELEEEAEDFFEEDLDEEEAEAEESEEEVEDFLDEEEAEAEESEEEAEEFLEEDLVEEETEVEESEEEAEEFLVDEEPEVEEAEEDVEEFLDEDLVDEEPEAEEPEEEVHDLPEDEFDGPIIKEDNIYEPEVEELDEEVHDLPEDEFDGPIIKEDNIYEPEVEELDEEVHDLPEDEFDEPMINFETEVVDIELVEEVNTEEKDEDKSSFNLGEILGQLSTAPPPEPVASDTSCPRCGIELTGKETICPLCGGELFNL